MAKILVLYYSMYGHVETMANAVAEGARRVSGAEVTIKRVPETMNAERFAQVGGKTDQDAAEATTDELPQYDAILFGTPTRFGNMASEMKYFWDQTTSLWLNGALHNKPACVFTSSGSMHGGQESTLLTMLPPLFHHGMMILGLPNSIPALSNTKTGGTPYGASHVSGPRHDQSLSQDEKVLCEAQGKRLGEVVKALAGKL